jgi:hypothetical protein
VEENESLFSTYLLFSIGTNWLKTTSHTLRPSTLKHCDFMSG